MLRLRSSRPLGRRSWRHRIGWLLAAIAVGLLVPLVTLERPPYSTGLLVAWEAVPFVVLGISAFVVTSRAGVIGGLILLGLATWIANVEIHGRSHASATTDYVTLPVLLTAAIVLWVLGDMAANVLGRGIRLRGRARERS